MACEDVPKLAESKPLCEGDTTVAYDILPNPLAGNAFDKIKNEAKWQKMKHQVPRLPTQSTIHVPKRKIGKKNPMKSTIPYPLSPIRIPKRKIGKRIR
ncbi:hypothetical protein F4821DRAFT_237548 [Hypoxylon rubiginosum]|uniref:Uncharacterized protein n=1 Tax=Hypoxylon rubiginosum TaxID=110542 RepID=A0ACC0D3B6_9PEZI|nr:hypothetical protein F4821DRAFT_237548 [Hypoxylon rubiginosum]